MNTNQQLTKFANLTTKIPLDFIETRYQKNSYEVNTGDLINIKYAIIEGGKERVQNIEGTVIAKKHGGINQTITIRRFIGKFGVEQVIFLNSPKIIKLTIFQRSKVRRSKLYYLRTAKGKAAKLKRKF